MALVDASGNTIANKAALIAKGTTVTQPTVYTINEDIYVTDSFYNDKVAETRKRKLYYAGQTVSSAAIDALPIFQTNTVSSVTPSTGLTVAGGTVVTLVGTNFDGVTSVTFGGTAGTSLVKVSKTKIKVTTPAKTAGTYAVVVNAANGTTAAGNVTFA